MRISNIFCNFAADFVFPNKNQLYDKQTFTTFCSRSHAGGVRGERAPSCPHFVSDDEHHQEQYKGAVEVQRDVKGYFGCDDQTADQRSVDGGMYHRRSASEERGCTLPYRQP